MSVIRNQQMRAAAFAYENASDCCNDQHAEHADQLRAALKRDPSFIGEAIGNGDLTNLVEAFTTKDLQRCWDAVSDLVDEHLSAEECRARSTLRAKLFSQQSEWDVMEHLATLHGVAA